MIENPDIYLPENLQTDLSQIENSEENSIISQLFSGISAIFRVKSNKFSKWEIYSNDFLLIGKSIDLTETHLCIIILNDEVLIRQIRHIDGHTYLMPESANGKPFPISEDDKIKITGTIKYIIHKP
jgi:SOS-response transcriptional repressor LexA